MMPKIIDATREVVVPILFAGIKDVDGCGGIQDNAC